MKKNLGTTDRILRLTAAAIFAILLLTNAVSGLMAVILGVLAIAFVVTSSVSFCPLYLPFKFSTDRKS